MSENYAFPDRIRHFRFDRKMTMGDHLNHDPSDWHWYVRADLYDGQAAEGARLREALRDIIDTGGRFGTVAHMENVDRIARAALKQERMR